MRPELVIVDPARLPAAYLEVLPAGDVVFAPPEPVRRMFRKRKAVTVSQWAERYRTVTEGPLAGGPWRNSVSPQLVGIMDAAMHPAVREVVICKAPQFGGTELVNNCVGYLIDRRPGNVLYIFPDEKTARHNCQKRVQTMIVNSRRLAAYTTGRDDDFSALQINLAHMSIYTAWASSPSSLANKSVPYLVFDETDKYPPTLAREADPISLGEKRARAFPLTRKIFKLSSPSVEAGPIWQALLSCAVIFEFWAKCPECGAMQVMELARIRVPDGMRDSDRIASGRLAWYECGCGARWDDLARNAALRAGEWRARESRRPVRAVLDELRPQAIGFHGPSWISPFVSLSEIMADWFRAQQYREKLKDFMNGHAAEPWLEYIGRERRTEAVMALKDDRPAGLVPAWALLLVLTADVQESGVWYELRAWGRQRTSALVNYGFLMRGPAIDGMAGDLAQLAQVARSAYHAADGTEFTVALGLVDSGYRTGEVYDFCRSTRGCSPSKGQPSLRGTPMRIGKIDTYPGTSKLIPGGVLLVSYAANHWKDELYTRLQVGPADPGAWLLHGETTDEYGQHYTAEIKDEEKMEWVQRGRQPNHLWDCGVLQLVAVDILERNRTFARLIEMEEVRKGPAPAARQVLPQQTPAREPLW